MTDEPLTRSPQDSNAARAPRFDVVDIVKGIAITLVVFGHTSQGLNHRGWWDTPFSYSLKNVIYSFHMPVYFLISGLFVAGSLRKRGTKVFVVEKTSTILYPYVLWTLFGIAFARVLGGGGLESGVSNGSVSDTVLSLLTGNANWFLYTLYCISILSVLFVRMPSWLRVAVSLLIAAAMPVTGLVVTDRVFGELPFFLLGMWLGREGLLFVQAIPKQLALLGAVLLFVFQAIVALRTQPPNLPTFLLLGLTGSAALFLCANFIETSYCGTVFAWLGRASLGVFLMHPFAQGATREVLARLFHTHNAAVHLIVTTLVATLAPALVWSLKDRFHYAWLFSFPTKKPAV